MKKQTRMAVLARDGYRCCYCGATPADGVRLEVDHFIPQRYGGTDREDNLLTACRPCNAGKSGNLHRLPKSMLGIVEPGVCSTCTRRPEVFVWGRRWNGSLFLKRACQDCWKDDGAPFISNLELGWSW